MATRVLFLCADNYGVSKYYESIDLPHALHPQTILAYGQLGYKQAKYVIRAEAVASLGGIGRCKGGYWEDSSDYAWYAGI